MTWISNEPVTTTLQHTRGDSASFTVLHSFGASTNIAAAQLTVKTYRDGDLVFRLTLAADAAQFDFTSSDNECVITVKPSDTNGVAAGWHWYDVKITHTDGTTYTFQQGQYNLEANISAPELVDADLTEWFAPFLAFESDLISFVLGMSLNDGVNVTSEDEFGRTFEIKGTPDFGVTVNDIPYIDLDGVGDYLEAPDADWNDVAKTVDPFTLIAVVERDSTSNSEMVASKGDPVPVGTPGFQFHFSTTSLQGSAHSGASIATASLTNGGNSTGFMFTALRFGLSTSVKVWGNDLEETETTGVPGALGDGTDVLRIGCESTFVSSLFTGKIVLVALYHTYLSDAQIAAFIAHCQDYGVA